MSVRDSDGRKARDAGVKHERRNAREQNALVGR